MAILADSLDAQVTEVLAGTPAAPLSPVDQVLQAPVGKSLLDSRPVGGHVAGWWWMLPLSLGVIGGIVAWWFTRDDNRTVARTLLIAGVVVTVLTAVSMGPMRAMLATVTSTR